jgi:DNA/RNA endonuclease YhcR with UshA esterase domain
MELTVQNFSKATSTDRYYLNTKANYRDEDNFTVTFTKPVFDQLRARNITDPRLYFEQRTVRVTGVVTEFRGRLQIEIDDLSQIELIDTKSK